MRRAYTLIELLVFTGIFALVAVGFITVLVTATRVQTEQIAATSVEQESQFLLQQIQYYVEASSLVDAPQDTASSTLKLRMKNLALDPTIITLSGGQVTLQQGTGPAVPLTSSRVSVSGLTFKTRVNPPGHDAVAVNFTIKFTGNLLQNFSQAFQYTVARVSAATFDSNLIPSSTATYNVGVTGNIWHSINNTIYFNGTNVGIGTASPNSELEMGSVSGANAIVLQNGDYYSVKDASSTSRSLLTLNSSNNLLLRNAVGRVDINADVAGNVSLAVGGGSVGIGTTTPTDHLTVYGASDQVATIQSTDGSGRNVALHLKGAATNADWYVDTNRADLAGAGDNLFFYKGVGTVGTKMVIQDNGNVGIGTTNPGYLLDVSGTFAATIKNFDIQFPGDPSKRLVHSTLEGPEAGVYYRGEGQLQNGKATITLPSYFEILTMQEGRTVLLTPEFSSDNDPISNVAASYVKNGQFTVRAIDNNNPSQKFYWEVKAVRSDVPPLQVIRPAN